MGDLRAMEPASRLFGEDRGQPICRWYIERFLDEHRSLVWGRVLEVAERTYTRRFGGDRVTESAVLHVEAGNPAATIVGNLATGDGIPGGCFDAAILTQTLQCIFDVQGAARRLVLKQVPDTAAFAFYTDVLRPLDLDSPRMYGVVEVDGQRFLVMERVPQLKGIPVEQKLEDGIRWLLKKDHAIRARLRQTAAHLSVTPSARDAAIPGWVAAVERGLARRRGLLIAGRLTRLLVDHGHVLRELDRVLVTETPLTVSHNDLHPDNLLVSASPRRRLFVVDWLPSVDSILIDLVTLVREVKGKTRERLIGQYRSEMDFPGFDRALRAASLAFRFAQ